MGRGGGHAAHGGDDVPDTVERGVGIAGHVDHQVDGARQGVAGDDLRNAREVGHHLLAAESRLEGDCDHGPDGGILSRGQLHRIGPDDALPLQATHPLLGGAARQAYAAGKTDEALAGLTGATQIWRLSLAGTSITDAGLKHLAGLNKLKSLNVARTKVTADGIEELRKSLPECRFQGK